MLTSEFYLKVTVSFYGMCIFTTVHMDSGNSKNYLGIKILMYMNHDINVYWMLRSKKHQLVAIVGLPWGHDDEKSTGEVALICYWYHVDRTLLENSVGACHLVPASCSFSAEVSVRSPRRMCILITHKNLFWIRVLEKKKILLSTEAQMPSLVCL